jgi:hypothetical protein
LTEAPSTRRAIVELDGAEKHRIARHNVALGHTKSNRIRCANENPLFVLTSSLAVQVFLGFFLSFLILSWTAALS